MPTTLQAAPSTPDEEADLDEAACVFSDGHISPGTTWEEQEQTQRASSRNRSPTDSTVESSCARLPDNDGAATTHQSYKRPAQAFDGKDLSTDDDKLHCQGPSGKSNRNRDSISPKKTRKDSENDSSQEGSSGGGGCSDVDGNDNGDESDDSSGTASDDGDNGGDVSRQYDSDYTPSETDKDKERPSDISSDDESDDRHRPRKRRRVANDQESDRRRRAEVRRAKSMSRSSPAQSPSRQSLRVGAGFAPSPPTSHDMSGLETDSDEDGIAAPTASFSEWPLHAKLKAVMIHGVTTYQLCFERACQTRRPSAKEQQTSHAKPESCSQTRDFGGWRRKERGRRVRFSAEEDELIIELKEELGLSWTEIYDRCSTAFVRRSKEALQVRYCTKLKSRR